MTNLENKVATRNASTFAKETLPRLRKRKLIVLKQSDFLQVGCRPSPDMERNNLFKSRTIYLSGRSLRSGNTTPGLLARSQSPLRPQHLEATTTVLENAKGL